MSFTISVVFPAYNEEANIERSYEIAGEVFSEVADDYEIIFVNDGSKDRTAELINGLAKRDAKVKPLHHQVNKGYAKALKTGFAAASMELIFYTDSDLQFDMWDVKKLLPLIEDADIAVGWRMDRQDTRLRIFVAHCYNLFARKLFGISVRDIDCAFKLFRREVFERIEIESEQFVVDTEILAKARKLGMRVVEVGVKHLPRAGGVSTVKPSHVINTLKGVARLKWHLMTAPKRGD